MFRIADHIASAEPVREGSRLYKAWRSDGRITAVQVFPFTMSPEQYQVFSGKAKLLDEVTTAYHANIPAVLNWGHTQSGNFSFIEREWIEGNDLTRVFNRGKIISVTEVGTIAEQMSRVLTHCHHLGLVHGNINLQHILWDEKREHYSLTGFRFGLLAEPGSKMTGNAGQPEPSLKEKDVHDLGLVLLQLLQEYLLPVADIQAVDLNSVANQTLKDGSTLPAWLATCIKRALGKGEEKFTSAHEMYSYVTLHHKAPPPINKWYRSKPQESTKRIVKTRSARQKKLQSALNSGMERGRKEMRFVFDRRIAVGLVIAGVLAGFSIIAQNKENRRNHSLTPGMIANTAQQDTNAVEEKPAQKNPGAMQENKKTAKPKKADKKKTPVVKPAALDSSAPQETSTTELGAYKVRSKAYFHTGPSEATRRKAFIVHWNNAVLHPLKEENDFVYVVFTNDEGQTSKGWLRKKDLVKL